MTSSLLELVNIGFIGLDAIVEGRNIRICTLPVSVSRNQTSPLEENQGKTKPF